MQRAPRTVALGEPEASLSNLTGRRHSEGDLHFPRRVGVLQTAPQLATRLCTLLTPILPSSRALLWARSSHPACSECHQPILPCTPLIQLHLLLQGAQHLQRSPISHRRGALSVLHVFISRQINQSSLDSYTLHCFVPRFCTTQCGLYLHHSVYSLRACLLHIKPCSE